MFFTFAVFFCNPSLPILAEATWERSGFPYGGPREEEQAVGPEGAFIRRMKGTLRWGKCFLVEALGMAAPLVPLGMAWAAAGDEAISSCNFGIDSQGLSSEMDGAHSKVLHLSVQFGSLLASSLEVKTLWSYSVEDMVDSVRSWGWRAGRVPGNSHGVQGPFYPQWINACSWRRGQWEGRGSFCNSQREREGMI